MSAPNTILFGDALEVLKTLPDNSVQCVTTSPPYFQMRDYLTRKWFGGRADCEHDKEIVCRPHRVSQSPHGNSNSPIRAKAIAEGNTAVTHSCSKCGGWYGQLGLEPTLDEYIEHMVDVFREVRRVLREDGTLWLNLGDAWRDKQLLFVPHRVALAMQRDGWWLRAENIWHKTNCMPNQFPGRPVPAHEPVFLFAKGDRYFYDADAVRQPHSDAARDDEAHPRGAALRDVWSIPSGSYKGAHYAVMPPRLAELCILAGTSEHGACAACGAPWKPVIEGPLLTGWQPRCACRCKEVRPCVVLDPFAGSGTVASVAKALGRDYLGIEINEAYASQIRDRILASELMAESHALFEEETPANDVQPIEAGDEVLTIPPGIVDTLEGAIRNLVNGLAPLTPTGKLAASRRPDIVAKHVQEIRRFVKYLGLDPKRMYMSMWGATGSLTKRFTPDEPPTAEDVSLEDTLSRYEAAVAAALAEAAAEAAEKEQVKAGFIRWPKSSKMPRCPRPECKAPTLPGLPPEPCQHALNAAKVLLGLKSTRPFVSELKDAYRRLAKLWHPDLHPNEIAKAQLHMSRLNQARDILAGRCFPDLRETAE